MLGLFLNGQDLNLKQTFLVNPRAKLSLKNIMTGRTESNIVLCFLKEGSHGLLVANSRQFGRLFLIEVWQPQNPREPPILLRAKNWAPFTTLFP